MVCPRATLEPTLARQHPYLMLYYKLSDIDHHHQQHVTPTEKGTIFACPMVVTLHWHWPVLLRLDACFWLTICRQLCYAAAEMSLAGSREPTGRHERSVAGLRSFWEGLTEPRSPPAVELGTINVLPNDGCSSSSSSSCANLQEVASPSNPQRAPSAVPPGTSWAELRDMVEALSLGGPGAGQAKEALLNRLQCLCDLLPRKARATWRSMCSGAMHQPTRVGSAVVHAQPGLGLGES